MNGNKLTQLKRYIFGKNSRTLYFSPWEYCLLRKRHPVKFGMPTLISAINGPISSLSFPVIFYNAANNLVYLTVPLTPNQQKSL